MRFDDSCLSLDLVKKKVAQEKEKHSKHSAEGLRNEIGKVGREKESLRKEIAFYRNKINVTKIGIKEVEETQATETMTANESRVDAALQRFGGVD